MTLEKFQEIFERADGEHSGFDDVENKLSNRADIHAFLLIDKLLPVGGDILSSAAHDQVWLSVSVEDLAKVISEDQIVELARCGVWFDSEYESLSMFV